MTETPNIVELIESGRAEEAVALLTKQFRVAAAAGSRSTKLALEVSTRLYGGDLRKTIYFMNTPHPWLSGDTPLQRAERSQKDLNDMLDMIGQIEAGVYT